MTYGSSQAEQDRFMKEQGGKRPAELPSNLQCVGFWPLVEDDMVVGAGTGVDNKDWAIHSSGNYLIRVESEE